MFAPWLIALDLDGTLLKRDHNIGEATKKALRQAIESGHIVAIATGRPPRAAKTAYQELQLTTPLIALNGAYIQFSDRPDDCKVTTLPQEIIEEITKKAIVLGSRGILAELGTHCVIRQNDPPILMDEEHEQFFYDAVVAETPEEPAIYQPLETPWPGNAYSLLIQLPRVWHQEIHDWLEAKWPHQLYMRSWRQPFDVIEVMSHHVSKATGLMEIQRHYQIEKEHIIAFGDEMNDLEMFRYAAIGVAMGNANPQLLPYATHVTEDCENDGIAAYLNQRFFPSDSLC